MRVSHEKRWVGALYMAATLVLSVLMATSTVELLSDPDAPTLVKILGVVMAAVGLFVLATPTILRRREAAMFRRLLASRREGE